MASFRCYDKSHVIAFLIMTNFHLYLIKLWWQFFQMFVYGDVVMLRIGRYWPWKTVTVSSHLHMPVRPTLLHRMALVSFLLFRKNLGNLREFFGQMVYRPPWQKISRTPMNFIDLFTVSVAILVEGKHGKTRVSISWSFRCNKHSLNN